MGEMTRTVPPEAIQVLRNFMDAGQRKDEEGMKACLTRRTIESGEFRNDGPENVRFVLGEGKMEGEIAVIPVKAIPLDAPDGSPPAMEMDCLVVQEDGQWRFDLSGTVERMMGGDLGKALHEMTQAMGKAMEGIGQAMTDAFNTAFSPDGSQSPTTQESSEPQEAAKPQDDSEPPSSSEPEPQPERKPQSKPRRRK